MEGGARFRILRAKGGGSKFPEGTLRRNNVVLTSMRHNDVDVTSFQCDAPTRFLINQCQIITFLILKSDIIEKFKNRLKGIVLPVPSNQIKFHLLLFYPSTWYIFGFYLFHIKIEGKCCWIIGGVGGKVCWPHSQIIGGAAPLAPFFLRLCKALLVHFVVREIR